MPNLVLWIVIAASLAGRLARPEGRFSLALDAISQCALTIWALDEVLRGVNPWRRCLGAGVLIYIALGLWRLAT